ncbi:MAG: alpha/beta hydrolase [Acidisphaera sp.]|nr:alpha/beta hydrolase [Acidisphaera sp.]
MLLLRFCAGLLLAGLAACAPVDLLNDTIPTGGITITRNVAYGAQPRQTLDIYRPKAAERAPVVVFIYGGAWQHGSKSDYLFVAAALARRGVEVVVPDYRLSPAISYPVFLQDCARAVAWASHSIAAFGGDPGALFLMGHSAGAYIVAMLALDPVWLAEAGSSTQALRGAIGLAGPYDFLPIQEADIKAVFGPAQRDPATQPVTYADGRNPPMLLLAGSADTTVRPRNTESLAAHIRAAGGPVAERIYPGVGHIGLILSFAAGFRGEAPALDDTLAFIRQVDAPDHRPDTPLSGGKLSRLREPR